MTRKRKAISSNGTSPGRAGSDAEMRIIGGEFRGRRLRYHGDRSVRPMKHRVREAIFNLISTESTGCHAIDLFAGTGALGLEALSRGAASATFIEKHVPTARIIAENIGTLGVEDRATRLVTSAFLWSQRDLPGGENAPPFGMPWLVFCSPPYRFYLDRRDQMLDLIRRVQRYAPTGSTLVVESDEEFDISQLIGDNDRHWNVRTYRPAVVGIWRNRPATAASESSNNPEPGTG